MNGIDLTACLELNLLLFLSRIVSVVVSGAIRVARPLEPLKSGCKGGVCLIGEKPGKELPGIVVVVVDSHIQRIVLAIQETTATHQVSHRSIKCQSRLWSEIGTTVNGSHHGDNPLLRPTGI